MYRRFFPLVPILILFMILAGFQQSAMLSFAQQLNQTTSDLNNRTPAPAEISGTDFHKALQIIESDSQFQKIVHGKGYAYQTYGFVKTGYSSPWYPSFQFVVGKNDVVSAVVALDNQRVVDTVFLPGVANITYGPGPSGDNRSPNVFLAPSSILFIAGISAVIIGIGGGSFYALKKGKGEKNPSRAELP